jgi:CheY-like chemotaxis protein
MMVKANETNSNAGSSGNFSFSFFDKDRIKIERFALLSLGSLIIAVILLGFRLLLPAGCVVVLAAALGTITVRSAFRLVNKVKNALEEISTSSEKKDDVITDFSHRIREPLNNLVIIGDLLLGSGLHKKQKELLETLIASTNNMVTTVNELTMQSAGNLNFDERKRIRFNLASTIQNTIDLFMLKGTSNIEVILSDKESSQYEVTGNPITLKQIILDLFNSIESQVTDRLTKVSISVKKLKDTGDISMFNIRFQSDSSLVLIDEHGLFGNLAAKLIINNKGSYHQESGNNITILDIIQPFHNIIPEVKQKIGSSKIEELKARETGQKELKDAKVLLVEDNIINQKITHLTLQPLVASIDTASNGKEALDKFGTSHYDLILMDIRMPVMSGIVATEKIRALEASTNAHVPIIAITANAMLGDKEKCISAGMDDYISKPFQPVALVEIIKKHL